MWIACIFCACSKPKAKLLSYGITENEHVGTVKVEGAVYDEKNLLYNWNLVEQT